MTLPQKLTLFLAGLVFIIGSFYIVLINGPNINHLVAFYLMVILPTALFFFAFSKNNFSNEMMSYIKRSNQKNKSNKIALPIFKTDSRSFLDSDNNTIYNQHSMGDNLPKAESLNRVLYIAHSIWPFDFFPDTVCVQEKSLTLVRKKFWGISWTEFIPIHDMGSARLYTGPFFASLVLERKIPAQEIEMKYLHKKDAIIIKELIDALLLEKNKVMDIPEEMPLPLKTDFLTKIGKNDKIEHEFN